MASTSGLPNARVHDDASDGGLPSTINPTAAPLARPRRRDRLARKLKKIPALSYLKWSEILDSTVKFISNPLNIALIFWCVIATLATIVLGLLDVGALNTVITNKKARDDGIEICTQIIDALFVLMCLVFHPEFCRQTFQLFRWNIKDQRDLRKSFCKGGVEKPHDRIHMGFVLFWLHMTCLATYGFAIVYWVYPENKRPAALRIPLLALSWGAPVLAFLHLTLSSLHKTYDLHTGDGEPELTEGQSVVTNQSGRHIERMPTFVKDRNIVASPEWQGGVCSGCCSNKKIACLSCLFPFCIFGLNAERLGFGQRWVQATTFILIFFGPYLIFILSASSVNFSHYAHLGLLCLGAVLAWLGLLYAGYWRTQMRRKYKLPAQRWCLGSKMGTDACIWLFCCWCALCQEVRTAEHYGIDQGTFYFKEARDVEAGEEEEEEMEDEDEDEGEDEGERMGAMAPARPMEMRG
eukprot:TRINITY_DN16951_c0_g1_i1.p1 TRINITY_DN16951_c0_g1~~TRINITY_DN16951_c0_g1_i1.p1  ORF type:complete len:465 (-),score=37.23 TRINITY_DN16951_c0_g1_i1:649-2043(-)